MNDTNWISVNESCPEPHVVVQIKYFDARFKGSNKPVIEGEGYLSIYDRKWHIKYENGSTRIPKRGVVAWRYIYGTSRKKS